MSNGHKLIVREGAPGNLATWKWRCECGGWSSETPAVGPYGRTSAKARIAQVKMAHGKHARAAIAKAQPGTTQGDA